MMPIQGVAPGWAVIAMAVAALGFGRRARRLRLEVRRELILGPTAGDSGGGDLLPGVLVAGPGASWAVVAGVVPCAWAGWFLGGGPTAVAAGLGAGQAQDYVPIAVHQVRTWHSMG